MSDEKTPDNAARIFVNSDIMRFKDRLQEAMNGESSRVFAARCGLSDGVIRNYLTGKTYPSLDRLAQIAGASGKPIEWFITGNEGSHDEYKNAQHDEQLLDREELNAKLIAIVELMSDREIARAVELFRRKGFEALMPGVFAYELGADAECVPQCDSTGRSTAAASFEDDPLEHKKIS